MQISREDVQKELQSHCEHKYINIRTHKNNHFSWSKILGQLEN